MATNKSFWAIFSGLDEETLLKTGEEVKLKVVLPEEQPVPRGKKKRKLVDSRENSRQVLDDSWLAKETHGQLSIDLYEQGENFVIMSTIAGVKQEDIEIIVEQDLITIRGQRRKEEDVSSEDYFYQECFWGKFSRTLVLPKPVESDQVKAEMKNGILRIILPKAAESSIHLKPK